MKFSVIDIKADEVVFINGKSALARFLKVSVPTIGKWFAERNVYLHCDKVIGLERNGKPIKRR